MYQLTVCLWDLAKALVRPLVFCQSEFLVELVIQRAVAVQIKPQGLKTKLCGILKEAKQNSVKESKRSKALWKGMTDERNR